MKKLFTIFDRPPTPSSGVFVLCSVLLLTCLLILAADAFGIFGFMVFLSIIGLVCATIIIINSEED